MAENIDSRILAYPDTIGSREEEQEAARELRERKNSARSENEDVEPEEENMTLRQRVFKSMKENEKKESKVKAVAATPLKTATDGLLKKAWMTLIPSWGLSLIYINMHVFLRWVFPDLFCKLGDEWKPKIVGGHSSRNIAGTAFGISEVIGLLFLDIIAISVIFAVLALLVMIVDFLSVNWLDKIITLLGLGWGGLTALAKIFIIPSN